MSEMPETETFTDINPYDRNEANASNVDGVPVPQSDPESGSPSIYYDMSGEKHLIIFNHFTFKKCYPGKSKPAERKGSAEDTKRLREVFEALDFNVRVHQDLDYDEIMDIVHLESRRDHSTTSCFAVAILTHGGNNGRLSAADQPYFLKDILVQFQCSECTLVRKPKLFFVQACRGREVDSGVQYDGGSSNAFMLPSHADTLVMFSSVEDYVGWRDVNGSWMIQELCNVIQKYSGDLDILHLVTIASRRVAYDRITYNPDPDLHNKKTIPETLFTLTKLLKFERNAKV